MSENYIDKTSGKKKLLLIEDNKKMMKTRQEDLMNFEGGKCNFREYDKQFIKLQEEIRIVCCIFETNNGYFEEIKHSLSNISSITNSFRNKLSEMEYENELKSKLEMNEIKNTIKSQVQESLKETKRHINEKCEIFTKQNEMHFNEKCKTLMKQNEIYFKENCGSMNENIQNLTNCQNNLKSELEEKRKEIAELKTQNEKHQQVTKEKEEIIIQKNKTIELLAKELENMRYEKNEYFEQAGLEKQRIIELKSENLFLKEKNDELNSALSVISIQQGQHLIHHDTVSLAEEIENITKEKIIQKLKMEKRTNKTLRNYIENILSRIIENNPQLLEV